MNFPLKLDLDQSIKGGIVFVDAETGEELPLNSPSKHTHNNTHQTSSSDSRRKSWELTKTGSFKMNGMQIKQGIVQSPDIVKQKMQQKMEQKQNNNNNNSNSASTSVSVSTDLTLDASQNILHSVSELKILSVLGSGAAGTVKKAFHFPSQSIIAIKYVNFLDDNKRKQFADEISLYLQYSHPNLVSFRGCCIDTHTEELLLALEYCENGSLQSYIQTHGALNELQCKEICKQIISGLSYFEQIKTVHRDIKPANILLDEEMNVKIADFGITKSIQKTMGMAKTQIGTVIYMSPERMTGDEYSFKSDVWGFGLTILYACMGESPYTQLLPQPYSLLDVHMCVVEEAVPVLPKLDVNNQPFSICFQSFIAACLFKDPKVRWKASDLLMHPFLL